MKMQDLMAVIREVTPVPPIKIVVSKWSAPLATLPIERQEEGCKVHYLILGAEAWKELTRDIQWNLLGPEATITAFHGVPVTFEPSEWRP